MSDQRVIKNLNFVGSSKKDLSNFPEDVKVNVGYALFQVQQGKQPLSAKPLRGFAGASVLEIIENSGSGTYRSVYTVQFRHAIYVLHCFQKKSKHGIKTPKRDIDLIHQRLKTAVEHYKFSCAR